MGDVLELDTTEQIEGVEEEEEAVVSQVRVFFDRYSVIFPNSTSILSLYILNFLNFLSLLTLVTSKCVKRGRF